MCLPTAYSWQGRGGERDMCGWYVRSCSGAPEVDAGLVAVKTRAGVVGAGSRTLPVVVATLGLLRGTLTDGVLKSMWYW